MGKPGTANMNWTLVGSSLVSDLTTALYTPLMILTPSLHCIACETKDRDTFRLNVRHHQCALAKTRGWVRVLPQVLSSYPATPTSNIRLVPMAHVTACPGGGSARLHRRRGERGWQGLRPSRSGGSARVGAAPGGTTRTSGCRWGCGAVMRRRHVIGPF
jgi:hypothetical protein